MNYPLAFPTSIAPSEVVITGSDVTTVSTSPFTFKQQVLTFEGQRWSAQVTIPPCREDLAEPWVTFLLSLKGRVGTFLMGDPLNTSPKGSVTVANVAGGSQTGGTLSVDGGPPNEVNWFRAGDWFQLGTGLNSRLYKVLTDTDTDGSGAATLDIWPNLRTSPTDNQSLILTDTKGLFRRSSSSQGYSINSNNSYNISFSCEEAL